MLTPGQKAAFERDCFLVLKDFVAPAACDALKAHVEGMMDAFDPSETTVIFTTQNQENASGDYFLSSGDKIRFFF
jgi:phytanoyl-CoA hydroxylase